MWSSEQFQQYVQRFEGVKKAVAQPSMFESRKGTRRLARALSTEESYDLFRIPAPNSRGRRPGIIDVHETIACIKNRLFFDHQETPTEFFSNLIVLVHGAKTFQYTGRHLMAFGAPTEIYPNDLDVTIACSYSWDCARHYIEEEMKSPYSRVYGHGNWNVRLSQWVPPYIVTGSEDQEALDLHYIQIQPGINFDDYFIDHHVDAYSSRVGHPFIRGDFKDPNRHGLDFHVWEPLPVEDDVHMIKIPFPGRFAERKLSLVRIPRIAGIRVRASYEVGEQAQYDGQAIEAMQEVIFQMTNSLSAEERKSIYERISTEVFKAGKLVRSVQQGLVTRSLQHEEGLIVGPQTIIHDLNKIGFSEAVFGHNLEIPRVLHQSLHL